MEYHIVVTCPYCGKSWPRDIPGPESAPLTAGCWKEEGGCGKYFAFTAKIKVEVRVEKLEKLNEIMEA
jgi:sarcosine oxidase delta subunit